MARLPRLAIDQQLHHLRHDAAAGRSIFADPADRRDLLDTLFEVSRAAGVAIHAYVLLPSRLQLLLTPEQGKDLAPMMQRLGRRFVGSLNRRHDRTGSPWAGRYRTAVLQASRHLLDAMNLLAWAPVAEGLAVRPEDWPASSYAHHAGLAFDRLITDHPVFWALGNTPFERESAFRRLCGSAPDEAVARAIVDATVKGWAIGDAGFIAELSGRQARRLLPARRGRPTRVALSNQSDPIK